LPTARLRALLLALLLPLAAVAQDNPPLHIIVPTPPGGTNDTVARALQQPLQKLLARTVIVEYKAGAAGSLGSAFVARAKPDGNTLLLNNNAVLINPLVSGGNGYEMKDVAPVAVAAASPLVLIANGDLPVQDTRELVAYAAKQAQPLPYASSGGVGSIGHLAMESFARAAGIRLLHVPYTGGAPAQVAVLTGEVKLVLTTLTASHKAQAAAGKLRLLGVAAAAPSPLMPGVRPIAEAVPGFEADAWFGLLAPAQTPPATVQRIAAAVQQALELPETREQLQAGGVEPTYIAPEAFARRIRQEAQRWGEVLREQKIRKE
jgi:tripartite-type tricarboxylate transporter receptor subunit TctC